MIQMSLSLQGQRWSRFDAKARLPFKMAQGTVKRTKLTKTVQNSSGNPIKSSTENGLPRSRFHSVVRTELGWVLVVGRP